MEGAPRRLLRSERVARRSSRRCEVLLLDTSSSVVGLFGERGDVLRAGSCAAVVTGVEVRALDSCMVSHEQSLGAHLLAALPLLRGGGRGGAGEVVGGEEVLEEVVGVAAVVDLLRVCLRMRSRREGVVEHRERMQIEGRVVQCARVVQAIRGQLAVVQLLTRVEVHVSLVVCRRVWRLRLMVWRKVVFVVARRETVSLRQRLRSVREGSWSCRRRGLMHWMVLRMVLRMEWRWWLGLLEGYEHRMLRIVQQQCIDAAHRQVARTGGG